MNTAAHTTARGWNLHMPEAACQRLKGLRGHVKLKPEKRGRDDSRRTSLIGVRAVAAFIGSAPSGGLGKIRA